MTLKVLAGLLIGMALALGLHPLSRSSLVEAYRPVSSPEALTAPFTALRLPSPDDPEAASAWMMAWLAERYRGISITEDQLLLLTEIAQAGGTSEPRNAYWKILEGLLQHDLGNEDASRKALRAALKAPGFVSHSTTWAEAVLRGLRDRDGSARPSHLLSVSEAIKAWSRKALQDPKLPVTVPEANAQLWIEGLSRLEYPSSSSQDEAALAQLPLALAQSIVFWGGTAALLALVLMTPSFSKSLRALAERMDVVPLWLKQRLVFAPLIFCTLFCVAVGGPGRIIQGMPQTPQWLFWSLVALILAAVVAASGVESDPEMGSRPGWTASSCAALGLAGGALLIAASLWANPFIIQLERALGPR